MGYNSKLLDNEIALTECVHVHIVTPKIFRAALANPVTIGKWVNSVLHELPIKQLAFFIAVGNQCNSRQHCLPSVLRTQAMPSHHLQRSYLEKFVYTESITY